VGHVDFLYDRGQFFLPLSIEGSAPHYFIVDTGAGISAIDIGVANELRLPIVAPAEVVTTVGTLAVNQVRIARLAPLRYGQVVDDLAWNGLTPIMQDLGGFTIPIPHTREAGLLGNDYLQGFVIHLRFAPPGLEIDRPAGYARPTGYAPAGVDLARSIPFVLDQHQIVRVQGTLDGWMGVDLRLDTGSATMTVDGAYLNITAAMWRALCARQPAYRVHDTIEVHGIGGKLNLDVATITSLDVGPLRFDRVNVVVQPAVGYFASPDAVGFIALNLFAPGRGLTLDYPARRIYF
jgi:hypothetical protein